MPFKKRSYTATQIGWQIHTMQRVPHGTLIGVRAASEPPQDPCVCVVHEQAVNESHGNKRCNTPGHQGTHGFQHLQKHHTHSGQNGGKYLQPSDPTSRCMYTTRCAQSTFVICSIISPAIALQYRMCPHSGATDTVPAAQKNLSTSCHAFTESDIMFWRTHTERSTMT